jgi:ATP-dependent DNA ligase
MAVGFPLEVMAPELARALPEQPARPVSSFEPKLYGYRAVLAPGMLRSRKNTDLAGRFPEIVAAVSGVDVVLDGEIVAVRQGPTLDFPRCPSDDVGARPKTCRWCSSPWTGS